MRQKETVDVASYKTAANCSVKNRRSEGVV